MKYVHTVCSKIKWSVKSQYKHYKKNRNNMKEHASKTEITEYRLKQIDEWCKHRQKESFCHLSLCQEYHWSSTEYWIVTCHFKTSAERMTCKHEKASLAAAMNKLCWWDEKILYCNHYLWWWNHHSSDWSCCNLDVNLSQTW